MPPMIQRLWPSKTDREGMKRKVWEGAGDCWITKSKERELKQWKKGNNCMTNSDQKRRYFWDSVS